MLLYQKDTGQKREKYKRPKEKCRQLILDNRAPRLIFRMPLWILLLGGLDP